MFEEIGVKVKPLDIEACHRVPSKRKDNKKPLIVRFVNRKIRDNVFKARTKLKSRKDGGKIYINEHLSPHNRYLFNLALKRKKEKGYRFLWTKNGTVFLKEDEGSEVLKVVNENDLL